MKLKKYSLLYNYNEKIKNKLQLKYKQFNIKKIEFIKNIIIIQLSIKGYDIKEIHIFYNSIYEYNNITNIIDCYGYPYLIEFYNYDNTDLFFFCNNVLKYFKIYNYIRSKYK